MTVYCYVDRAKPQSRKVMWRFAQGCGGHQVPAEGRVFDGPAAIYGVTERTKTTWDAICASGRDYYYIDNGYLGAGRFRVAFNCRQTDRIGLGRPDRLEALAVHVRPWRRDGSHVLIVMQSPWWYRCHVGVEHSRWLADVVGILAERTDRPIRIRQKPRFSTVDQGSVEKDLARCWAVVTDSSNVAVKAICAGIPAFVTGESAARLMGNTDLTRIEKPVYADNRRPWLEWLAANQWTLDEMERGVCWRELREIHGG